MSAKRPPKWRKLDNAAKIFPPNCHGADTKVFRYTCELYEPVDPELLQRALDETLPEFPVFCSVLRQGVFWYYLEESDRPIRVEPENMPACSPLYMDLRSPLLRVVYFDRRFSFEMFHALADGTGAIQFFRVLTSRYLSLAHAAELGGRMILPDFDASVGRRMADSFARYYDKSARRKKPTQGPNAAQLHLEQRLDRRLLLMEGRVPLEQLKAKAKEHHATMTVLLAALMIEALAENLPVSQLKKPVMLSIPVNLRSFFPSDTCRNFFSVFDAGCKMEQEPTLDEVILSVQQDFERRLTKDHFAARLASLASLEYQPLARVVPLPIKNLGMNIAYRVSAKKNTASVSNIGRIDLPAELACYVAAASACNSTGRILLIASSFGDTVTLSFTSAYLSTDVQRSFFCLLTNMGVEVTLTANDTQEGEQP